MRTVVTVRLVSWMTANGRFMLPQSTTDTAKLSTVSAPPARPYIALRSPAS